MSGFTGAGCSVAGVTGKKLSLVSFVCFGVVGISAVDCIKHKREGRDSEKYRPVILHLLPASATTAGSTTSCRQKTLTNKKIKHYYKAIFLLYRLFSCSFQSTYQTST